MREWRICEAQLLTSQRLDDLFSNRMPAIRISTFANPVECRVFANGLRQCDLRVVKGATDHSAPSLEAQKIAFIGLTQFEFKCRLIEDYLDAAEATRAEVVPVFAAAFDPVERLMAWLRICVDRGVAIACDTGGSVYAASIIRSSNEGLALHADFAPYQMSQLSLSDCTSQLAWNFYAEMPGGAGGHTVLHNSPWTWRRNRKGEVAENYSLPYSAVELRADLHVPARRRRGGSL